MPVHFKLDERLIGYALSTARPGEQVSVQYRELIGPADGPHLQRQLENLQGTLFSKIPSLPLPSMIDHILVVIAPDLSCTAYVNELNFTALVKTTGAVKLGAPVYVGDIRDITRVTFGVDVPPDCGVVIVRSAGWRRSLFFDFGPFLAKPKNRTDSLERILAQQALLLLGLVSDADDATTARTGLQHMETGLGRLKKMLSERCAHEGKYQALLHDHPWMLGGYYRTILRHASLDDRSIPDFTAERCYDACHDIIELKQPFLKLFTKSSKFSKDFNDSWNQAERYLAFALQHRTYLYEEKELQFENPRCLLLLGYGLTRRELQDIRRKEILGRAISVFTWEHVVETASNVVLLMRTAHERALPRARVLPKGSPARKKKSPPRSRTQHKARTRRSVGKVSRARSAKR